MAKVNKKTFKEALISSGGNQSIIAKRLEVSRAAITLFLNKNPELKELRDIEAERIIDVAENNIDYDITNNKDIDSSKWKLLNSKRGKSRGYGPKIQQEHSGEVDNKIELEIIEVQKKEDEISSD